MLLLPLQQIFLQLLLSAFQNQTRGQLYPIFFL